MAPDTKPYSWRDDRTDDTRETLTAEIADAYDETEHLPCYAWNGSHYVKPIIRDYYRAFQADLRTQFDILSAFVDITVTETDPYAGPLASSAMFADIREHRHLSIYSGGTLPAGHPMAETAMMLSDRSISWNVVFRAVHDGLAHFPGRNNFGLIGEWRAFQAHARMMTSDVSRHALFTETLAQNAWYQVHGTFAPQKAVLLPWDLVTRAIALNVSNR